MHRSAAQFQRFSTSALAVPQGNPVNVFEQPPLDPPVNVPLISRCSASGIRQFLAGGAVLWRANRWCQGLVAGLVLACGVALPATGAEQLSVKLGPLRQSVMISDLQYFALTGEVIGSLRPYALLLNEQTRQTLDSRIPLDPAVGDQLVGDVLNSSAGDRLLTALQTVIPNSNRVLLHQALTNAATHANGLSLIGFLQELQIKDVVLDLSAAWSLTSQLNLPYWQSQALSSVLERELTVPTPKPLQSTLDPTENGRQWVRQQTLVFRDYQRDRTIPVDLYWSRRTQGPLVVISHGFGADRRFLGYLAYHLATHGFTVAALEHPASNVAWLTAITSGQLGRRHKTNILPATEFIDRPGDVSFLLSELDRMNLNSTILRGKLNTQKVVVIGHSLGGYTALALAGAELDLKQLRQFCNRPDLVGLSAADWLQCTAADLPDQLPDLRDRRVAEVIALNPVIGQLFDPKSLAAIRIPTMIMSGTGDAVTPAVSQQLLPFTQLHSGTKFLLTAIGGSHLSVGDPNNLNEALIDNLFMRERRGEDTESLRRLLKGVTLSFVKQLTPDAKPYQAFLTSAYAQSFSTPGLELRLNSELSANLSNWLQMAALPMEQITSTARTATTQAAPQAAPRQPSSQGLTFLVAGLPLVMFILPGSLLFYPSRLFRPNLRNLEQRQK